MYIVRLMFVAHLVSGASDPPFQTDNKLLELCIVTYMPKNQPLVVVTSPLAEGSSWPAMDALCRAKHPGYALAHSSKDLVYDARTLCPSDNIISVRPEKVFKTMTLYGNNVMQFQATKETAEGEAETLIYDHEAMDWTTSESTAAADDTKFRCGVCQMVCRDDVLIQGVYPPHEISDYAYEIQLISTDPIEDISHFANGSDLTNKLLADLAKALEILAKSLRWHGATLNGDRKAVVHVYYEPENVNRDWFYYVHWNDKYLSHKIVDNFEITMIKINNECVLSNYALKNSRTSFPVTGDVDINFDAQKGTLTTRECVWDETSQIKTAVWTQGVDWLIVWGVCDLTPGEILHHLSKEGMQMYQEVKTLDLESAFLMQFALQTKVGKVLDIQTLVGLTNLLIVFHSRDTTKTTYFGLLTYSMPTIMAKAYISLLPQEDNKIQMHRSQYINVLVAAVEPANPVVGMAVTLATVDGHIVSNATQLHRADMSKSEVTSNIVVTVSESITLSANCIHVAMYGAHLDTPNDPPLDAAGTSWMTFVVVAFTRNVSKGAIANDDFVDIAFKPAFREESQKGVCAEWKSETGEWYSGNCRILKSTRDAMVV